MEQIQAQNSHLQQHATNVKDQKEMLNFQLHEVEQKYEKTCIENKQLAIEIQALRQSLQVGAEFRTQGQMNIVLLSDS